MDFYEVLDQVIDLLQKRGRASYRALTMQFNLDDASLEVLKEELIEVHQLATDLDGKVLVWTGEVDATPVTTSQPAQTSEQPPTQPDQPSTVESLPPEPPTPDAERRQLTVMFCDLADSTRLSGQLDPEDLRDVIRAYQSTGAEVIERYDGYIAQHLGDGLMVYFGWPQAHEDDAQRAVHAGLGILDAMAGLNTRLEQEKDIRLAVRIGIHTGLLAEAYGEDGQPEEGLPLLAEAVAVMDDTEARFFGAELYRLKGELLLRQADPDEPQAVTCFQQAIDIAHAQQAKSWELRAATSLTRLWQSQGKRQDAYDLLAPVYEWFTEGFGTADLKEAKTLLVELT